MYMCIVSDYSILCFITSYYVISYCSTLAQHSIAYYTIRIPRPRPFGAPGAHPKDQIRLLLAVSREASDNFQFYYRFGVAFQHT